MDKFPSTQIKAPVNWTYGEDTFELEFHVSIIGSYQNPKDGTIPPCIGWFVPHVRILGKTRHGKIKGDIFDLLQGHKEEIDFVEVMDANSIK